MPQVKEHTRRKTQGIHYTPAQLARFLSAQVSAAYLNQPLGHDPTILDPALGDGELAASLVLSLRETNVRPGRVYGFDTDGEALREASDRLRRIGIPAGSTVLEQADFVRFALGNGGVFAEGELFHQPEQLFDMVIANPPYVRTQVMGAARAQQLAGLFKLSGRVDLYHAFILAIARVLHPGGYAAVIVSNRFMTTKSGADVRSAILRSFDVLHVWDLGDTKLFEAAVLPALLLMRKKAGGPAAPARFTAVYEDAAASPACSFNNILDAMDYDGSVRVASKGVYTVRQGLLDHSEAPDGIWRLATDRGQRRVQLVRANTGLTFGDIGKIRVGVKTCADNVFIRRDWDTFPADLRPELLRPLTTHRIARRFKPAAERDSAQILYPHTAGANGRAAVDLRSYPKSAAYLEQWRKQLEGRRYLIDSGRNWYEIWVPQDPALWQHPKLVFRDIASEPMFWLDVTGTIVNGDCYWIQAKDGQQDLIWLAAAVGNSSFAEWFYDVMFNNKLYAGRRRFMTQYVKSFPLPAPDREISQRIVALAKETFNVIGNGDASAIERQVDDLVWDAFGLSRKETAG